MGHQESLAVPGSMVGKWRTRQSSEIALGCWGSRTSRRGAGVNLEGAGATAGRVGARLLLSVENSARLGFTVECAVGCSRAGETPGMSTCDSSALPRSGCVSVHRLRSREPGFGGGPQTGTTGPCEGVMACGGAS